jgi:acyl phosphate:glycerol-3-phosphate acyltransferase
MLTHSYSFLILLTLFAYLLGSLSSAIIVCKIMGLPDPRTQFSQNPGASNVLRIGGKTAALLTMLGDMLKGLIAVYLAKYFGANSLELALVTFAVIIGHLYPIFFNFKGGKGVATFIGCLIAYSWPVAIYWCIVWVMLAFLFRYTSLASLVACLLAPFFIWYFTQDITYASAIMLINIFIFYRHRTNIVRLWNGVENRL